MALPAVQTDFGILRGVASTPYATAMVGVAILAALIELRPLLGTEEIIAQWEGLLALRDENVQVESEKNPPVTGQIYGLETDGSLRLRNEHGEFVTVRFGDVRLRPLA